MAKGKKQKGVPVSSETLRQKVAEHVKKIDTVTIDGKTFDHVIEEGAAKVLVQDIGKVFYNPAQVTNRDLSVLCIQQFIAQYGADFKQRGGKQKKRVSESSSSTQAAKHVGAPPISVLDALSATGLRALRYAQEIEGLGKIVANDVSEDAVRVIKRNMEFNDIKHRECMAAEARESVNAWSSTPATTTTTAGSATSAGAATTTSGTARIRPKHPVVVTRQDARALMYDHIGSYKGFHIVDLDPYGSAVPFIDAAVQCVKPGGMLMVTCTDMQILCGTQPEVSFARYGSVTMRTPFCHEMALRTLLFTVHQACARYKKHMVPLLSLSIDFYVRVFVRIVDDGQLSKRAAIDSSLVFLCMGCGSYHPMAMGKSRDLGRDNVKYTANTGPPMEKQCEQCGQGHHMLGPYYGGALHDTAFIEGVQARVASDALMGHCVSGRKLSALLTLAREELNDVMFYYHLPSLLNVVHATAIKLDLFRSALVNAGYRVSGSHCKQQAIKTDAPPDVIWDVVRAWCKKHPVKARSASAPSTVILSKEAKIEVSFDKNNGAVSQARAQGMTLYPANPERNWGPMQRASGKAASNSGGGGGDKKRKEKDAEDAAAQGQTQVETKAMEPPLKKAAT